MKPPSNALATLYRPVTADGGADGDGGGSTGRATPRGLGVDAAGVGRAGSTVDRGDRPGTTGAVADTDDGPVAPAAVGVGGTCGSDITGSAGPAAGNVLRPRTEPSATTSRTTITTTPAATRRPSG